MKYIAGPILVAEALEAAHEKGIVHRDLKPTDIKLTAAGRRWQISAAGEVQPRW